MSRVPGSRRQVAPPAPRRGTSEGPGNASRARARKPAGATDGSDRIPPPGVPAGTSRAAPGLRFRVRGFSLLPAVPPGASVEIAPPGLRRPVPGDLVVVEIGGVPTCHVVESVASAPDALLVTRGLWARDPDPPVPADALLGFVTVVVLGGLRVPATGLPFRAWLAAGRSAAPFLRLARAVAWNRVPSSWKTRLRRGLDRRAP